MRYTFYVPEPSRKVLNVLQYMVSNHVDVSGSLDPEWNYGEEGVGGVK